MTLRKTNTNKTAGANGFPAEAKQFFDEVADERMAELRAASAALTAAHDLELLDGIDFPYRKPA